MKKGISLSPWDLPRDLDWEILTWSRDISELDFYREKKKKSKGHIHVKDGPVGLCAPIGHQRMATGCWKLTPCTNEQLPSPTFANHSATSDFSELFFSQ